MKKIKRSISIEDVVNANSRLIERCNVSGTSTRNAGRFTCDNATLKETISKVMHAHTKI